MFFQPLRDIANKIIDLDANVIVFNILNDPNIKEFVLNLIREDQLFGKGENYLGVKLENIGGPYSQATIDGIFGVFEGKRQKGLPFDRVTLFDEGEFYKSFELDVNPTFFQFDADYLKDGFDLRKRWGDELVGLNTENLDKLVILLRQKIIEKIKSEFGIAA